jgi:hypothetical protein
MTLVTSQQHIGYIQFKTIGRKPVLLLTQYLPKPEQHSKPSVPINGIIFKTGHDFCNGHLQSSHSGCN